jgi:hypothetical protein
LEGTVKKFVIVLACCCLMTRAFGSEAQSSVAKSVVGLWKLIRIDVRQSDGRITTDPDLGPRVVGYIYYDATGHMGVQLMNPDRPKWKSEDQPTADEAKVASSGFEGYSGTYEVLSGGYVVHHLEVSFNPNVVGQSWKRKFEIRGNQLSLTPPPFKTVSGETVDETLVWERVR